MENIDYVLNGYIDVDKRLDNIVYEIFTKIKEDPENEFLKYLAREIMQVRIKLMDTNKFTAESMDGKGKDEILKGLDNYKDRIQSDNEYLLSNIADLRNRK